MGARNKATILEYQARLRPKPDGEAADEDMQDVLNYVKVFRVQKCYNKEGEIPNKKIVLAVTDAGL